MGNLDSRFMAQMEQLLWLYSLPYDPKYPVVCFDERPCFLIGEVVSGIGMQSGKVQKEHYAYEKLGSCALLAAIEPLSGKRLAQVHSRRTKREYALFAYLHDFGSSDANFGVFSGFGEARDPSTIGN